MSGYERNYVLPDGIFAKHWEIMNKQWIKSQSFLDFNNFFLCTGWKNVCHNNKTNADQRCYKSMECLSERIKIR